MGTYHRQYIGTYIDKSQSINEFEIDYYFIYNKKQC